MDSRTARSAASPDPICTLMKTSRRPEGQDERGVASCRLHLFLALAGAPRLHLDLVRAPAQHSLPSHSHCTCAARPHFCLLPSFQALNCLNQERRSPLCCACAAGAHSGCSCAAQFRRTAPPAGEPSRQQRLGSAPCIAEPPRKPPAGQMALCQLGEAATGLSGGVRSFSE